MNSVEDVSVELVSTQNNFASGKVQIQSWDKKQQTARGLKALGVCWAIAVVSIILPIVHFVSVPLFFLAGPIAFYFLANQKQIVLGGKGECPQCHRQFDIVRSKAEWPLTDVCNHCQSQITIRRESPQK